MNAEGTRDKEGNWCVWYVSPGLSRSHAIEQFLKVKPGIYTFETFRYDSKTGRVMTC